MSTKRLRRGSLVAPLLLALSAEGALGFQTAEIQAKWTHVSGDENWVARDVSLGNGGEEVFCQLNGAGLTRRLLDENYDVTGTPVWQSLDPSSTFHQKVASSATGSLHASARDQVTPSGHVLQLRLYGPSSQNPLWTFQTAPQATEFSKFDLLFSHTGDRLVLVNELPSIGRTVIRTFTSSLGTPVTNWQVDTLGAPVSTRLSTDGSRLFLASTLRAHVLNLDTEQVEYTRNISSQIGEGHGFSGAGDIFALGFLNGACCYHRPAGGSWDLAFCKSVPLGALCNQVTVSEDGTRMALSYSDPATPDSATIELIDIPASLAQGDDVVLWSHTVSNTGQYANRVSELKFSSDGGRLVVGLWGDAGGSTPEILIFDQDQGVPATKVNLPGSVLTLSITRDGRKLVVGSKSTHNSIFAGDGSIDYFDLEDPILFDPGPQDPDPLDPQQFTAEWSPANGGSLVVRAGSAQGSPVRFLVSRDLETPSPIGNMGLLYLDRDNISYNIPMGMADVNGQTQRTWQVPAVESGQTLFIQTLSFLPRRLSENWVQITVP